MYLGKRIRIAIVDNDRLTLGVMTVSYTHLTLPTNSRV